MTVSVIKQYLASMSEAPTIWFNGEFIATDRVHISPLDLGLRVGLGVFETMVAYQGKVFAHHMHYCRMERAAEVLGIFIPEREMIEQAIEEVIAQQDQRAERLRIRVSVSGGDNTLEGGENQGDLMVSATVIHPDQHTGQLAKLVKVPYTVNEQAATAGLKTASYADYVLAYRYALKRGGDEALMLNTRGHVCEAAMSNLFLVKDGVVKTPTLSSGCLAGVTRELVMGQCLELGFPIKECELTEEDVLTADELILTSSVREVQGAVMIQNEQQQSSGEITAQLAAAYAGIVREELGL